MTDGPQVLKDQLFNQETVTMMARALKEVYPAFEAESFVERAIEGFKTRELKARSLYLGDLLYQYLPKDFEKATQVMKASIQTSHAGPHFIYSAYSDYVWVYGCNDQYYRHALALLADFTQYFSAEFAIRAFINAYPDPTFEALMTWSKSGLVDLRRLASEGLRPKLPWAMAIKIDYKKATLPLHNLFYDQDRYVTRSVANHLNDVSKIDPSYVIGLLRTWQASKLQEPSEMAYITHHALRTLVKRGHPETLNFLGYPLKPAIEVGALLLKHASVQLGESLSFECSIKAQADTALLIDYIITYATPGDRHSEKVFKLKKTHLSAGDTLTVTKNHPLKVMTTKKLYPGTHTLTLQVNGRRYSQVAFELR